MSHGSNNSEEEPLSKADLIGWLEQEIKDTAKAFELRTKQAKELIDAISRNQLTVEDGMQGVMAYERRWREALPGASVAPGLTDEQILTKIDKTHEEEADWTRKHRSRSWER